MKVKQQHGGSGVGCGSCCPWSPCWPHRASPSCTPHQPPSRPGPLSRTGRASSPPGPREPHLQARRPAGTSDNLRSWLPKLAPFPAISRKQQDAAVLCPPGPGEGSVRAGQAQGPSSCHTQGSPGTNVSEKCRAAGFIRDRWTPTTSPPTHSKTRLLRGHYKSGRTLAGR